MVLVVTIEYRGADGEVTTVLITRHRTGQETHKLNIESDMGSC